MAAVAAVQPPPEQLLGALTTLSDLRRDLDRLERLLIETARENRTGWGRIAAALGLASRQAAEQRYLRLCGEPGRNPGDVRTTRARQRNVDTMYGRQIGELRSAAAATQRQIAADPGWDGRHPRAALARASLEAAITADPGSLYALVDQAAGDLKPLRTGDLPAALGRAIRQLRQALAAARPT